jgi:hypothetical protein
MTNKVRVNLANAHELLELVGISETEVRTIVRFRAEHGSDRGRAAAQRRSRRAADGRRDSRARRFCAPSEATAPEAPGA